MAKFELYQDGKGEYRWRLKHTNGQTIAVGGEGYTTKRSAKAGIESVKKNAPDAEIVEGTTGNGAKTAAKPVAAAAASAPSPAEGGGRLS